MPQRKETENLRPWNCCGKYHICQNIDICNEREECRAIGVAKIWAEDGIEGRVHQVECGDGFRYLFTIDRPRRFERWNRNGRVLRRRGEEQKR